MRILINIPSVTSYYTFLHDFCEYARGEGVETHVATSSDHVQGVDCYREPPHCQVHHVGFPRGGSLYHHWRAAQRLRSLVKQLEPDLVHSHFSAAIFTTRLARQPGWPAVIGTVQGLRYPQLSGVEKLISQMSELWAYGGVDALWVVNRCDVTALLRAGHRGMVHCQQSYGFGCDLTRFDPAAVDPSLPRITRERVGLTGGEFVLIFIGRQVHFKGFGLTVRAFFRLYREYPHCRLLLLGTRDPLHPTGLTPAEELELAGHPGIRQVGWKSNVEEWLAISDLNVFPSQREGMPVNLMESLAMGVPVVTLGVRGCRDVVRHGVDGVVLEQDDVETLHATLARLSRDPDQLKQFSLNALSGRKRFDQKLYFEEQLRIYQEYACPVKGGSGRLVAGPDRGSCLDGKKITYVVSEDWYFKSHRLALGLAALRRGADVSLLCNVSGSSEDGSFRGIHIHHLPLRRRSHTPFLDGVYLWRLCLHFWATKPDIVHLVGLKSILYGSIASRFSRATKVVCAFAGLGALRRNLHPSARRRNQVYYVVLRNSLRCDRLWFIVQNREDQDTLQQHLGIPGNRFLLLPGSGVDLTQFKPAPHAPAGSLRVVLASRLLPEKGIRDFAQASSLLRSRRSDLQFILAGRHEDALRDPISTAEIDQWEAGGLLHYAGQVTNMAEFYRSCHIAVLPSYYGEGIPKCLLEAAACGLPIITTDSVGCRDVVQDGVDGLLVPPQDAEALARAIEMLAANPDLCEKMGKAARRKAEQQYGLPRIVNATLDLYERILAHPCDRSCRREEEVASLSQV